VRRAPATPFSAGWLKSKNHDPINHQGTVGMRDGSQQGQQVVKIGVVRATDAYIERFGPERRENSLGDATPAHSESQRRLIILLDELLGRNEVELRSRGIQLRGEMRFAMAHEVVMTGEIGYSLRVLFDLPALDLEITRMPDIVRVRKASRRPGPAHTRNPRVGHPRDLTG